MNGWKMIRRSFWGAQLPCSCELLVSGRVRFPKSFGPSFWETKSSASIFSPSKMVKIRWWLTNPNLKNMSKIGSSCQQNGVIIRLTGGSAKKGHLSIKPLNKKIFEVSPPSVGVFSSCSSKDGLYNHWAIIQAGPISWENVACHGPQVSGIVHCLDGKISEQKIQQNK